jgi:ABC-type glycerol-3-phosphate transport system substrate-binding protein
MIIKKVGSMIVLAALIVGMIGCAGEKVIEGAGEGSGQKNNVAESPDEAFVYVPTYHALPVYEGVYPIQTMMTDGSIYFISIGSDPNESDALYCIPLIEYTSSGVTPTKDTSNNNTSHQAIPLSLDKGRRINQYAILENSEYLLLSSELDLEAEVITLRLEQFDSSGQQLKVTDVSPQVNEDLENNIVSYMAVDGEGNIYLCGSGQIWLYDKEGLYQGKIPVSGYISALETGTDGKVYLLFNDTEKYQLVEIDFREQKLGKAYGNIPFMTRGFAALPSQESFLLNDEDSLWHYDLTTQSAEKLLDYMECDIDSQDILEIGESEDGTILLISAEFMSADPKTKLITLTKTPADQVKEKEIVTVASLRGVGGLKEAILAFNQQSDRYRVVYKSYGEESELQASDTPGSTGGAIAMMHDITGENGPDLLFFFPDEVDMAAYASKGVFQDINMFLDNSDKLHRDDLVESVVNAFTYDGKLVSLPVNFTLQSMIAKTSMVGDTSGWTIDDLEALMERYPDQRAFSDGSKEHILETCLANHVESYIDWEAGTCDFRTDGFLDLLTFCNEFQGTTGSVPDSLGAAIDMQQNVCLAEEVALRNMYGYHYIMAAVGEPITFIGYPTKEGFSGHYIQTQRGSFGISAMSKHQEGAWEFLQFQLLQEADERDGFPVRKGALENLFTDAMTPIYQTDENGNQILDENGNPVERVRGGLSDGFNSVMWYAATEQEIDNLRTMIDEAKPLDAGILVIMNIVQEESAAYFAGQKTLDEVVELIQNRAQLYVQENS